VLDDSAVAIAVDGTSVYWHSPAHGDIRKANLDGSNEVSLAPSPFVSGNEAIAVNGSSVYWGTDYALFMAPTDGSAAGSSAVSLVVRRGNTDAIAFDATHVYWTDDGAGVYRANLDGSNATLIATGQQGRDFVIDGSVIYWAQYAYNGPAQILRVGTDGTGQAVLAQAASTGGNYEPGPLDLHGTTLYFGGYYGGTLRYSGIFSEDLNGSPLRLLAVATPEKILVDDQSIYWSAGTDLLRIPNTGGEPHIVASVPPIGRSCCSFEDLVQDDAFVYFCTDTTAGGIWKVAK
jgi:hypothetical protein